MDDPYSSAATLAGIFTNISPNVVVTGNGDAATNYLDVGAATNYSSRFYRVRLAP